MKILADTSGFVIFSAWTWFSFNYFLLNMKRSSKLNVFLFLLIIDEINKFRIPKNNKNNWVDFLTWTYFRFFLHHLTPHLRNKYIFFTWYVKPPGPTVATFFFFFLLFIEFICVEIWYCFGNRILVHVNSINIIN